MLGYILSSCCDIASRQLRVHHVCWDPSWHVKHVWVPSRLRRISSRIGRRPFRTPEITREMVNGVSLHRFPPTFYNKLEFNNVCGVFGALRFLDLPLRRVLGCQTFQSKHKNKQPRQRGLGLDGWYRLIYTMPNCACACVQWHVCVYVCASGLFEFFIYFFRN